MTSVLDDATLARAAAADAARILVELRAGWPAGEGARAQALRDAADAAAHRVITERLVAERPDDVVFSEEAPDPRRRLASSRVWIVDPLDGTREYGEPGRADWAVHVALWSRGVLDAAAVALPERGEVSTTDGVDLRPTGPPAGAAVPRTPRIPRIAVSRSRPPAVAAALAEALGAELVPMGSAGAKTAAVWHGDVDAYVHTGGLHEWDVAAPVAVATAAGLHASRLNGDPLVFNRPEPYVPDLLVCVPELAGPILARTAGHSVEVIG